MILFKTHYYIISLFLSTFRPILNPKPLNLGKFIDIVGSYE